MSKFYEKYKNLFEGDSSITFPVRTKPITADYNIMSFNTLLKQDYKNVRNIIDKY